MLPILIPPSPRKLVDFAAARRIDERDAHREPIVLDDHGNIIDDLEERRRRWRRRCGPSKVLVVTSASTTLIHPQLTVSASLQSCERVVSRLFWQKVAVRGYARKASAAFRLLVPGYGTVASAQPGRCRFVAVGVELAWTKHVSADPIAAIARTNPNGEVVDERSRRLAFRFGRRASPCTPRVATNVYRFWQCVVERMRQYDFTSWIRASFRSNFGRAASIGGVNLPTIDIIALVKTPDSISYDRFRRPADPWIRPIGILLRGIGNFAPLHASCT